MNVKTWTDYKKEVRLQSSLIAGKNGEWFSAGIYRCACIPFLLFYLIHFQNIINAGPRERNFAWFFIDVFNHDLQSPVWYVWPQK